MYSFKDDNHNKDTVQFLNVMPCCYFPKIFFQENFITVREISENIAELVVDPKREDDEDNMILQLRFVSVYRNSGNS